MNFQGRKQFLCIFEWPAGEDTSYDASLSSFDFSSISERASKN